LNSKEILKQAIVLPVIVIDKLEDAVPMAKALVAGGIRCLEVTLRSPVALEAISLIAKEVPDAIVGVGSVRNPQDWRNAIAAGAEFGVSPGCTDALADAIIEEGKPFIPGVATPSEVMRLADKGFEVMKLFPATVVGGVGMLKAIGGPIPQVGFCPTGGVSPANAQEFLALDNVYCVGGSWMLPSDVIAAGDWDKLTELAKEAVAACS